MRRLCVVLAVALSSALAEGATFTVTNNANSGAGSLRQAITDANAAAGTDTIVFAIGAGAQTIVVSSQLPTITGPVVLDAETQPGFAGTPLITVDCNGATFFGLFLTSGSTIQGLIVTRCGVGIFANGSANTIARNVINASTRGGFGAIDIRGAAASNNVIVGNRIGTDAAGMVAVPNVFFGVLVSAGANNRIGGPTAAERNVVSGNAFVGIGLDVASNTRIEGNHIGTNAAGTAAIPNTFVGIFTGGGSTNTTIGGTASGTGNVVSGNSDIGILDEGNGTVIAGNRIGTDAAGTTALGNTGAGIDVAPGAANTVIGGTVAGARNTIAGSAEGISVRTNAATITGNFIGTDVTGAMALPNEVGIFVSSGGTNATIGGSTAAARNVISGNRDHGIWLNSGSTGAVVQGNFIGTDATGTVALGNLEGVLIRGTANQLIGNVISGNSADGIILQTSAASASNTIAGNLIGTNAAGTAALPNGNGILLQGDGNTIGGTTAASRNVISGNAIVGIGLFNADDNLVQGNFIGTDISGTTAIANGSDGIFVNNSLRNQIGGTVAGAANRIRFNGSDGVDVSSGTANAIRQNAIGSNTSKGIELAGAAGETNDAGDADTGANNLQNFPVVTAVVIAGGTTFINATLNSSPSTAFAIDLFNNTACDATPGGGEGETFVATTSVTTDSSGNATFIVPVASALTVVTGTATDPAGNTSQFSACRAAVTGSAISINDVTAAESAGVATFTVTASPAVAAVTTVQYTTANGTAAAPGDFVAVSGTVTFNPGESSKTITVTINNDVIDEINESFVVNLSNPTNSALADNQGQGTITDDDTATGSVNDPLFAFEGSAVSFTITLSTPAAFPVNVDFATQNGTATAPADYTTTTGRVTFAPGETTKTVSVPTIIDGSTEPEETFQLALTSPDITLADNSGLGTIRDVSLIPTLSTWMLMLLAAVLAAAGAIVLKRF